MNVCVCRMLYPEICSPSIMLYDSFDIKSKWIDDANDIAKVIQKHWAQPFPSMNFSIKITTQQQQQQHQYMLAIINFAILWNLHLSLFLSRTSSLCLSLWRDYKPFYLIITSIPYWYGITYTYINIYVAFFSLFCWLISSRLPSIFFLKIGILKLIKCGHV